MARIALIVALTMKVCVGLQQSPAASSRVVMQPEPSPWKSYNKTTGHREGGDPNTRVEDIPRWKRDKTGCASNLKDPESFWSGIAGEFGGDDFSPHHVNLTNQQGEPLNNLFCSAHGGSPLADGSYDSPATHLQMRNCTHYPCEGYKHHEHRRNCTRYPTERERFTAIQRVLKGTARLFTDMGLPYYLTSGSLLGEWRCGEVIPWSENGDIIVPAHTLSDVFLKILGRRREHVSEKIVVTHEDNPIVPAELVVWSWAIADPACTGQVMGIADRETGFYINVWAEEQGQKINGSEWLVRYWEHAPSDCPPRKEYATARCFKYPKNFVYPLRSCEVDGVFHKCPHDTSNFLNVEFGAGFQHAPVQYQGA